MRASTKLLALASLAATISAAPLPNDCPEKAVHPNAKAVTKSEQQHAKKPLVVKTGSNKQRPCPRGWQPSVSDKDFCIEIIGFDFEHEETHLVQHHEQAQKNDKKQSYDSETASFTHSEDHGRIEYGGRQQSDQHDVKVAHPFHRGDVQKPKEHHENNKSSGDKCASGLHKNRFGKCVPGGVKLGNSGPHQNKQENAVSGLTNSVVDDGCPEGQIRGTGALADICLDLGSIGLGHIKIGGSPSSQSDTTRDPSNSNDDIRDSEKPKKPKSDQHSSKKPSSEHHHSKKPTSDNREPSSQKPTNQLKDAKTDPSDLPNQIVDNSCGDEEALLGICIRLGGGGRSNDGNSRPSNDTDDDTPPTRNGGVKAARPSPHGNDKNDDNKNKNAPTKVPAKNSKPSSDAAAPILRNDCSDDDVFLGICLRLGGSPSPSSATNNNAAANKDPVKAVGNVSNSPVRTCPDQDAVLGLCVQIGNDGQPLAKVKATLGGQSSPTPASSQSQPQKQVKADNDDSFKQPGGVKIGQASHQSKPEPAKPVKDNNDSTKGPAPKKPVANDDNQKTPNASSSSPSQPLAEINADPLADAKVDVPALKQSAPVTGNRIKEAPSNGSGHDDSGDAPTCGEGQHLVASVCVNADVPGLLGLHGNINL